jgi:hypothetical protein
MGVTELILLILGGVVFLVSFLLPAGRRGEDKKAAQIDEEQIKEIIDREVEAAKTQISDIVDETITYSMEKTERSMDRLTNEKMMAVNEYSDTVLEQINKNHKEAVFLYDMLNDKHENLKNTVNEAVKTATEVKQTVKDAEITAREAKEKAQTVMEQVNQEPEKEAVAFQPIKAEVLDSTGRRKEEVQAEPEKEKAEKPEKTEKPKRRSTKKTAHSQGEGEEKAKKAAGVDLSMTAPNQTGGRNNNERILELHKAGKSNMAIAKELSLGIGEVKLVIDLFEGI